MFEASPRLISMLLRWYDRVHADRAMPWRTSRDPYAIWVSEIMLQQTQVETVKPYYERFLARFPTVTALAAADLQDVLACWAGLGYYRRAKHLHAAARDAAARFGGILPTRAEALRTLPGIGRYTAGAIASIAFGEPEPVVDGNVKRVLARLAAYEREIGVPAHDEFFWRSAGALHARMAGSRKGKPARHGDLNQALMELGATVCVPVGPRCGACPLRTICKAHAQGREEQLPVRAAKRAAPRLRLAALVILRQGGAGQEVLLVQRPAGGLWETMWEFPAFESTPALTEGRLSEAAGLRLSNLRRAGELEHQLTHRTLCYRIFLAQAAGRSGTARRPVAMPGNYTGARWVAWPLAEAQALPIAAVVRRIAAVAGRA